jgi:hypothetical protein
MEACLAIPPLPWPALAGAPRAAGFAARILGYGHRSSFGRSTSITSITLVRVQAVLPLGRFQALRRGRHPGAAAVIPAVVHARRAFGLQFFPWLPTEMFSPLPAVITPLERQLRFRRA